MQTSREHNIVGARLAREDALTFNIVVG